MSLLYVDASAVAATIAGDAPQVLDAMQAASATCSLFVTEYEIAATLSPSIVVTMMLHHLDLVPWVQLDMHTLALQLTHDGTPALSAMHLSCANFVGASIIATAEDATAEAAHRLGIATLQLG